MTIVNLYEVIFTNGTVLRLADGESYDCADCKQPIVGDVWQSTRAPEHRCTGCAIQVDRGALGTDAVRLDRSIHQRIGTQNVYPVDWETRVERDWTRIET